MPRWVAGCEGQSDSRPDLTGRPATQTDAVTNVNSILSAKANNGCFKQRSNVTCLMFLKPHSSCCKENGFSGTRVELGRPVRTLLQGPREMRGWLGPGCGVEMGVVTLRTDLEGQGSRTH